MLTVVNNVQGRCNSPTCVKTVKLMNVVTLVKLEIILKKEMAYACPGAMAALRHCIVAISFGVCLFVA